MYEERYDNTLGAYIENDEARIVSLSAPHDFVHKSGLAVGQLYCRRCKKILEGFETATGCWELPVQPGERIPRRSGGSTLVSL